MAPDGPDAAEVEALLHKLASGPDEEESARSLDRHTGCAHSRLAQGHPRNPALLGREDAFCCYIQRPELLLVIDVQP